MERRTFLVQELTRVCRHRKGLDENMASRTSEGVRELRASVSVCEIPLGVPFSLTFPKTCKKHIPVIN